MTNFLRRPEVLLMLMSAGSTLSFAVWSTLINNFAIDYASFDGYDMGVLQSLREVPGFLAFAVVFLLLFVREQRLAYLSLLLLGVGTAITGFFPSLIGLCITTVLMSIGFHYYETLQTSLSLQWLDKAEAPQALGRIVAVGSFVSVVAFGLIWLTQDIISLDLVWIYFIAGGLTCALAGIAWLAYPHYPEKVVQKKHMVLRKRYWLYYALTFMSGARRQIFIVFAGFLMVEKFGFDVAAIAALFLINAVINMFLAPQIGKLIAYWGERRALILEYIGLIVVFTLYAFVDDGRMAAVLYVVDHAFFAMAIAIKTYFQKIADPGDFASTAGVAFTINHIAAVCLPIALGAVWLISPMAVFLIGAGLAGVSLLLSLNVPAKPEAGNEVIVGHWATGKQKAAAPGV